MPTATWLKCVHSDGTTRSPHARSGCGNRRIPGAAAHT